VFSHVPCGLMCCRGDPFANGGDPLASSQDVGSQSHHLHIRIQQRNGRKTLTTLQGLQKGVCVFYGPWAMLMQCSEYNHKKLLQAFKKVGTGL